MLHGPALVPRPGLRVGLRLMVGRVAARPRKEHVPLSSVRLVAPKGGCLVWWSWPLPLASAP